MKCAAAKAAILLQLASFAGSVAALVAEPKNVVPPPASRVVAGVPVSAAFVRLASDPRDGDNGYNTFKRMSDGRGITFGGFSHDRAGNNAVALYNPTTNAWQVPVTNTRWMEGPPLADGSKDVRGRTYLGNRDNHNTIVAGNEFWVLPGGQRGIDLTGNWSGRLNLTTWKWSIDDDGTSFDTLALPYWINSAAGVVGSVKYIFGGARQDNPWNGLVRINPDRTVSNFWDRSGSPAFAGAEKLRYISNSHFVRAGKVYVYGGGHEDRNGVRTNGRTLYQIDISLPAPVMSVVSVNTLANPVAGEGILADLDSARDRMVTTDGKRVQLYDFATGKWSDILVSTPADPDRASPSSDGAGRQGFWSPETDQYIILGGHGKVYGLRQIFLTAGGDSPPPAPVATPTPSPLPVTAPPTASIGGSGLPPPPTPVSSSTPRSSPDPALPAANVGGGLPPAPTLISNPTPRSSTNPVPSAENAGGGGLPPTPVSKPTPSLTPVPPATTPPRAGSLTMQATAVPYTGPSVVLGSSKHLDFARLGNRWYKMCGDHAAFAPPAPADQDGNQEIYSVNFLANDWRMEQPYYVPDSTKIQASNPDDAFVISRKGEIWYFHSVSTKSVSQPQGNFAKLIQPTANLMAWTPPPIGGKYGTWRVAGPWPSIQGGDRAWRGFYDPVKDRFIIPVNKNGAVWAIIDGATGADLTQYAAASAPYQYGDFIFSVAGVAPDFANRKFYVYDIIGSALYSVDMDAPGVPTKIANLPEPSAATQAAVKLTWHPGLRAIVLAATKLHAYEVDSNKLTTWARPDGFINGAGRYVPTSTIFYDPDSEDVVSIGTIDWDTQQNPHRYWRIRVR